MKEQMHLMGNFKWESEPRATLGNQTNQFKIVARLNLFFHTIQIVEINQDIHSAQLIVIRCIHTNNRSLII